MDDRNFFDKIAPQWDQNEVLSTAEKIAEILDLVLIGKGDFVLDLGTGTGVLLPYIAQKVGETGKITAVDFSEKMLKRAIQKFSNLSPQPEFLNLDFENENIEGEYDKIMLYCVWPHLHNPVDTLKWLQKVNLKDNGEIFIAFPCGPDFINNIHKEKHSESDLLPPASVLTTQLRNQGLNASCIADTDSCYLIKIEK